MIIRIDEISLATLDEMEDFRSFAVVAPSKKAVTPFTGPGSAIEVCETDVAWVDQQWIIEKSRLATDGDWMRRFGKMVEYAQSKGWVRSSDGAIRAHIEYLDG